MEERETQGNIVDEVVFGKAQSCARVTAGYVETTPVGRSCLVKLCDLEMEPGWGVSRQPVVSGQMSLRGQRGCVGTALNPLLLGEKEVRSFGNTRSSRVSFWLT